jgi:hypothetical protein
MFLCRGAQGLDLARQLTAAFAAAAPNDPFFARLAAVALDAFERHLRGAVEHEYTAKEPAEATRVIAHSLAAAAGDNRPQEPLKVAQAVAAIAREDGLGAGGDDLACCRWLPAQLARARRFNVACAVMIAAQYGGKDRLAERLGMSRADVYRAIGEMPSDATPVTAFLARLGRLSRAEVRGWLIDHAKAAGRKPMLPLFEDGPEGDRVVCVTWLSLILGASKPVMKPAEWFLGLPSLIAERVSPGAATAAKLAALDAKPSDWLALMGEVAPVLGVAKTEPPNPQRSTGGFSSPPLMMTSPSE